MLLHTDKLWGLCYKTFYVRNLRVFVVSKSVCPLQAFQAWSDKHFGLV
jgi:hypothetical protein